MASKIEITLEQVQSIISLHRGPVAVVSFEEMEVKGCSAFTRAQIYAIHLSDSTACTLKIALPLSSTGSTYAANSLAAEHDLIQLVTKSTDIPQPEILALDTSLSDLPYHYLLLSRPRGTPLARARASGQLTERQRLLLDLRIGAHLKQLHERVQNDWFGLPSQARDEFYSWQEAFTGLLETLLEEAQARAVVLPYADVRQYLSRAIGFFLFDDCEVPSLVSFAGDEETVLVDLEGAADDAPITSFLSFSHAVWGDPLLETLLLEPSPAVLEGYGGPLVVFARQKTKRLWYTLFLALMVIVQSKREEAAASGVLGQDSDKVNWADGALSQCIIDLKDAPYY